MKEMNTKSPKKISLSIFFPAYNEEENIAKTVAEAQAAAEKVSHDYEIIVVNDGSTDHTAQILQSRNDIKAIGHSKNLGYGAALKTGIRHARYTLIVITDADGTYPNERIPDLIALTMQADMVVGARIGTHVHYPTLRSIPKWFLVHFAQWITRSRIPDLNSGLRVFRKSTIKRFLGILPDTFSFTTTITLAMLTNNYIVHYEPINYHPRVGRSKIKPIRDTLRFIQLILRTGVYFAPLRIFLPIAGIFLAGFLITLFQDIVYRQDLTERTLILLVAATQLGMFALLADMIHKRSTKL